MMYRLMIGVLVLVGFYSVAVGQAVTPEEMAGMFDAQGREMSYLQNGTLRIGVDLELGGAITHLEERSDGRNLINSYDWGRQVQQSYYGGPGVYDPEDNMHPDWPNWSWNPIQVGDVHGNSAEVLEHRNDGERIYVRSIPMQWALDDVPGECEMETEIRFVDEHVVAVTCRLRNDRPDATWYGHFDQELPAVYTIGELYRLYTYTGTEPFTGDEPERIRNNGPPWEYWKATENWAALLDEDDWGLGTFHPGVVDYVGGFHGTENQGGPRDGSTGYASPLHQEILDHDIDYEYTYYLVVGELDEIRQWVDGYEHDPRPHFVFSDDRQHWVYPNTRDAGWPIEGGLEVHLEGPNPAMLSPDLAFAAEEVSTLYIRMAHHLEADRQVTARLSWQTHEANPGQRRASFEDAPGVAIPVDADGEVQTYEVDVSSVSEWEGLIWKLQLVLAEEGGVGERAEVQAITHSPEALP